MDRSLAALAAMTGGRLVGGDRSFAEVSSDSRTLEPGSLFVALRGESFDGHDFVAAAAERGAVGALVDRELPVGLSQVVVRDSLVALASFGALWRRQFRIPVVGVTGSNGKTTTKELTGAILDVRGPCLVTRGNLNNHIGVPLTLCRLEPRHASAVVEMGANHAGEIAHLCSLAQPSVGLVTNAGAAHLEGFGGLDGVARAKGEMFESLGPGCTAVINADDAYAEFWRSRTSAGRILTFGLERAADFSARACEAAVDDAGFMTRFDLVTPEGEARVTLRLAGRHNILNALAAAATAWGAGAALAHIRLGLERMRAVAGRLELRPAAGGAFLIDDSYNANPDSLKAGIDALSSVTGSHWLVLGDMAELGPDSEAMHAEIGRYARNAGVERLLAVGPRSRVAVEAFGTGATWYADAGRLASALRAELHPGVTVLIKGSRVNRLERVAEALASDTPHAVGGGH